MYRKLVVIIFLVFSYLQSSGQKIDRGLEAFERNDYNKAIEIFEKLIRKDSTDVGAKIAYVKARTTMYESNLVELKSVDYETLITLINEGIFGYQDLKDEVKAILQSKLFVYSTYDVTSIRSKTTRMYWENIVSKSDSIALIEEFRGKYLYYFAELKNESETLLAKLYFEKAKIANSVFAYQAYLNKFPKSRYDQEAKRAIEELEYQVVMSTPSVVSLEKFLKKYPSTSYREATETMLATFYFDNIKNKENKDEILIVQQDLTQLLPNKLARSLVDSCYYMIYKLDRIEAMNATELSSINEFLSSYKTYEKAQLEDVIVGRNTLWNNALISSDPIDFSSLINYLDATKIGLENISQSLLTKSFNQFVTHVRAQVTNLMYKNSAYFGNSHPRLRYNSLDTEELNELKALTKLISKCLEIEIEISKPDFFRSLKLAEGTTNEDIYSYIINQVTLENLIKSKTIYFKVSDFDDRFVEVIELDMNGALKKRKLYEFNGDEYQLLPEPSTNHSIFAAIKTRYGISSFSSAKISSKNERGYVVQLYGYSPGNLSCCPTYDITVLYSKTANKLVPITAIEIYNNYYSLDATINLSNFTSVNKDFIINQLTNGDTDSNSIIESVNNEDEEEDNSIVDFAAVEVQPEPPGGTAGWGKYLQKNMKYPPVARENNITGRVIVSFVVEKNGDLSDVKVLRGIGGGCDEEAVRVLKASPAWKPGVQNGRSVRCTFTMPIFFQLPQK